MIKSLKPPRDLSLSLDQVRAYLKVSHPSQDSTLMHLVRVAEEQVAHRSGHYALSQTIRLCGDFLYECGKKTRGSRGDIYQYPFVTLQAFPIQEILSVTVEGRDGSCRQIEKSCFSLQEGSPFPRLQLRIMSGVRATVDMVVGYGDDPELVPATLQHEILTLVRAFYEHSEHPEFMARFPRKLTL